MKTERYYPTEKHEIDKSATPAIKWARAFGVSAFVGLGLLGINHISDLDHKVVHDYGDPNMKINSVTLDDEARLRSEPQTDLSEDTNVLVEVHLKKSSDTIQISTPDGVHETNDQNGKWIGIEATDLPANLQAQVKSDSDGIVWVNEQKATETTAK